MQWILLVVILAACATPQKPEQPQVRVVTTPCLEKELAQPDLYSEQVLVAAGNACEKKHSQACGDYVNMLSYNEAQLRKYQAQAGAVMKACVK